VKDGGPRPVASKGRLHASRSKPSGAQVSYFKAVDVLAAEMQELRFYGLSQTEDDPREWAARVLREALPEKQKARLTR
jgi:hypothetical protein